jgi:hypothetical protein
MTMHIDKEAAAKKIYKVPSLLLIIDNKKGVFVHSCDIPPLSRDGQS